MLHCASPRLALPPALSAISKRAFPWEVNERASSLAQALERHTLEENAVLALQLVAICLADLKHPVPAIVPSVVPKVRFNRDNAPLPRTPRHTEHI